MGGYVAPYWNCSPYNGEQVEELPSSGARIICNLSTVVSLCFLFGSCHLSTGVTCVIRRLATQHQGQSEDSKSSSPSPIKLHLPHKQPLDLTKKSNVGLWVDPYRRGCGYAVAKMKRSVTVRSWWQTCSTELCQQMVRIAASLLIAKPPNLQNKFFSGFPAGSWDPFHF